MKYKQRDVLLIDFPLGYGNKHPVVILSNNHFNTAELNYMYVMLSTKQKPNIDFCFEITPEMITNPISDETSYAKLNLIDIAEEEDMYVLKKYGQIKIEPFKELLRAMNLMVFSEEGND